MDLKIVINSHSRAKSGKVSKQNRISSLSNIFFRLRDGNDTILNIIEVNAPKIYPKSTSFQLSLKLKRFYHGRSAVN